MSYTENQTEIWEFIGRVEVASHSSVQDTGNIDISKYTRLKVEIFGADGGANAIDIDPEQATNDQAGTRATLHDGDFDITLAAGEYMRVIEIRSEQFRTNEGYKYFNLEMTPAGARVCGCHVWGLVKNAPADLTNLAGVKYVQESGVA